MFSLLISLILTIKKSEDKPKRAFLEPAGFACLLVSKRKKIFFDLPESIILLLSFKCRVNFFKSKTFDLLTCEVIKLRAACTRESKSRKAFTVVRRKLEINYLRTLGVYIDCIHFKIVATTTRRQRRATS